MNPVPLFLIIVTLPLLLGGCGEKYTFTTEPELELRYTDDEELFYKMGSDIPYTGKEIGYLNGNSDSESNYKNGVMDGPMVIWHPNGKKVFEAIYENGNLMKGSVKWWNNKGEPVKSEEEAYK